MRQKYIYLMVVLFLWVSQMQGQTSQLESIGNNAFYGAKIGQGMSLPPSLKGIGTSAFQSMTIPCLDMSQTTGLEQIGSNAFYATNLTSVNILDLRNSKNLKCYNTSNINGGSFAGFSGEVLFPFDIIQQLHSNSLETIGVNAFFGLKLTADKTFDLSKSHKLLRISNQAFQNTNIETIILPDSLTYMGNNTLSGSSNLKTIVSNNVIPPALGTTVFQGVDTLTCKLEVPEQALDAYGIADQWKAFLNKNSIGTIYPDEYQKGREGSVFIRINATGESGRDLMGYDYDKNEQSGERHPTDKTYKTIEIGESVWTTENIRFKAAYNTWLNHNQEAIDQELGDKTIALEKFEEKFGSFVSSFNRLSAYRNDFNAYYKRDSAEQQGWDLPTMLDFEQLIGLAPQTSDDPIKNIMSFLGVPQDEVPAKTGNEWYGYKNTSGFSMTPLGRRIEQAYPDAQYPKLWYSYGRESGFKLKDYPLGMIVFSETDNVPIRVHEDLRHQCQARYTRKKTDEELGYRLFVDLENDEVLITGLDQKCSDNLQELAPGIARGVALRYMKKEEKVIIKSWSEIQQEAEQIRKQIKLLRPIGTSPQQIELPATSPFRECIIDQPNEYEKGKEGSVFIRINTNAYSGRDFMGYDYDQNKELGEGQPIEKTYRTIEIGETVWTSENTRFKTAYLTWLNHNQQVIDQELGDKTIPLEKFEEKFGAWVSLAPKLSAYRDNFSAYYKRDSAEQQGWDLPSITDFSQLFGQAPAISDDPIKNIMTFLGVPQKEVPGKAGTTHWKGYTNTSGFNMTPLGWRHAQEGTWHNPSTGQQELWMNYGRESGFRLKDRPLGLILFSEIEGRPIHVFDTLTHLCQARYIRNKTDEELGYKLYVDICNDEIIMIPIDKGTRQVQYLKESKMSINLNESNISLRSTNSNVIELPRGLERGIALRYANFAEKMISKSWSEIVDEGETIRKQLKTVPIPPLPSLECVPETPIQKAAYKIGIQIPLEWADDNGYVMDLTWISSNPAVAKVVDNNKLVFLSEGTMILSVIYNEGPYKGQKEDLVEISVTAENPGTNESPTFSDTQNYIRTITYMEGVTAYDHTKTMESVQYFDGLGRPMQTVQIGITHNDKKSLATYQEYDAFGREDKAWLPVVSANSGQFTSLGDIQTNAATLYSDSAYSRPVYEASPLNRILEQYGPGKEWYNESKINTEKGSIKTAYLTNNDTDLKCIQYSAGGTRDNPTLIKRTDNNQLYNTGELYVTQITNEDGHVSYEFKDKLGQVVLTRQLNEKVVDGNTVKETLDTYYVYDDFGNQCFVLPPRINDEGITKEKLDELAYRYKYDERNRCIEKKIPGAEPVEFVYDKADRLIFTQDGEQKTKNQWLFTVNDALGRIALTGICTNAIDRNTIKDTLVYAERNKDGVYEGYSISGFVPDKETILTVNYYDDYGFLDRQEFADKGLGYDDSKSEYNKKYDNAKGLLTGTKLRTLAPNKDDEQMLLTAMYYDEKGRVIQTQSTNHLGGKESEYVAYNFIGQPTKRLHVHKVKDGNATQELYGYEYDHAGRLTQTKHQLDDKAEVILAENKYDDLGRLQSMDNATGKITKYDYNIRSWTDSIAHEHYKQGMGYTFSGNVQTMNWTQNGQAKQSYFFVYDKLSRLTAAKYNNEDSGNYSTAYSYDMHGNMMSLVRRGEIAPSTHGEIDKVTFTYNGNQIKNASDAIGNILLTNSMDFKNNANQDVEYAFNKNGAMTMDLNRGVKSISYNVLNLPQTMEISNTSQGKAYYTYSATGQKLQIKREDASALRGMPVSGLSAMTVDGGETTDYVGNFIYENDSLKRILVDNGYIEDGNYYFYVKDHLGNNRIVTDASGAEILQSNEYYPFGMLMSSSTNAARQPYKYNNKELDTSFDLNWYDFSARYQDGIRFTSIDPLAEKYYNWSPYVYCYNNPMLFVDTDGKFPTWSEVKHRAKTTVNTFASFGNGMARAIGDNMVAGFSNARQDGTYTDVGAYNLGQDVGDIASTLLGTFEMAQGAQAAAGSILAAPESAGISLVGVGAGAAGIVHGGTFALSGLENLATQKGRVSEMSSSKNSGGGKNSPHSNQKARESAAQKYETAKEQLDNMNKTPNKTPELKKEIQKLEREVKQLQQKKDFTGENHSRNAKGNR